MFSSKLHYITESLKNQESVRLTKESGLAEAPGDQGKNNKIFSTRFRGWPQSPKKKKLRTVFINAQGKLHS
jgi:hypothetical protein